ncbi:ankyrin [Hortaea werneckii]|nr:ankyrin [Hortaea werneckii]KAI7715606.1 ankyrin [Hortaea werneckii]
MSPSGRSTAESQFTQLSSRSRAILNDDMSEISPPSSVSVGDERFSRDVDSPKQAIRIKVDPSSVPRWRPKNVAGAVSAGAKQALFVAVQELNHEMVEHLLDSGVPADHGPDTNLLRMAVINHDIACVRLLLLFGADPNAKDKEDYTPLYAATKEFFIEAAQLLLKYGADPNISAGPKQENPLALAITDGRATFAHLFLKHGADPHITMGNTDTPFTQAMNRTTTTNLIDLMLTYDSNVNTKNGHGETALFKAINAERLDLVNILLDNGAQPNLPGPKHMLWPAVHRPQILALLLERGADLKRAPGCLELATSIISTESVQILLANGADPNAKKDGIFTPLCTAIRDDRGQLVDILLAAGADPNVMASEYPAWKCVTHHRAHLLPRVLAAGADPTKPAGIIEKAVECKNKEALRILLDERVSPNARNEVGCTALTTAIRLQDLEAIDTLLAYGADPSVRGQEWPTTMAVKHPEILAKLLPHVPVSRIPKGVLERSVQANQLESVKLLLAAGVDCEDKNGGVFSPLTTSIREDRKEIFQYLLETVGCDPNSPGEHLPIIKAIRRHRENDLSYIRALLAKGADINLMYRGWNAVLQALDQGDTQTLKLLAEMGTPDLHARDEDGMSVLEIMQDRGMKEEEKILRKGRESLSGDMAGAFRELRGFVKE